MNIVTRMADYADPADSRQLIALLDAYAMDPMGGEEPLSPRVRENLCSELQQVPGAFSLIAETQGQAVGLANCFTGFSTFQCKPLINIHDLAVLPDYRAQGVGQILLQAVEDVAVERGCCKVTLEVLSGNDAARRAYQKFGFAAYAMSDELGVAEFWQKYTGV